MYNCKPGYQGKDVLRETAEKEMRNDIKASKHSAKDRDPFNTHTNEKMRFYKKGGSVGPKKEPKIVSHKMNKGQTDLHIPKPQKVKKEKSESLIKATQMKYAKGGKVMKKAGGGTVYESEMVGMKPGRKAAVNYEKDMRGDKHMTKTPVSKGNEKGYKKGGEAKKMAMGGVGKFRKGQAKMPGRAPRRGV